MDTAQLMLLLSYVNILVLLYAIIYATRFLIMTQDNAARKPWELLLYGIIFLLVMQSIEFLRIDWLENARVILNLGLTTLLLLIFVIQSYHMKKENYDVLARKNITPSWTKDK